jgi:hypothetical protein
MHTDHACTGAAGIPPPPRGESHTIGSRPEERLTGHEIGQHAGIIAADEAENKPRPLPRTPRHRMLAFMTRHISQIRIGGLALALLTFAGCNAIQDFNNTRYDRNNEAGDVWLSDQMEPAAIEVSGTYRAEGWGKSYLSQTGRDVRGHLGDYPVRGVVSGSKLYLLVSEGGWYYYSAVLELVRPGLLVGSYSRSVPYRRDFRRDLELIANP